MNTNEVFDSLFKAFPKARESKSLNSKRPKTDLVWQLQTPNSYKATGPRGGTIVLTYNERSNKITFSRRAPSSTPNSWYVSVQGTSQGPFSPSEIHKMISSGEIAWDAHAWREAAPKWEPIQNIEELVRDIHTK